MYNTCCILLSLQTAVQEIPFRHNQIGIQQQLETLREQAEEIKPLKRKVDEFKKSKVITKLSWCFLQ